MNDFEKQVKRIFLIQKLLSVLYCICIVLYCIVLYYCIVLLRL